ncbi:MAG: stage II sporulation protein P [Clostridia bacterium]|nr:stage II sporulation protein P [Clostridia bacterium]
MKGYKAVVIDGKKIVGRIFRLTIFMTVVALCLANLNLTKSNIKVDLGALNERLLSETLPQLVEEEDKNAEHKTNFTIFKNLASFFLTLDVTDPRSVLVTQIPLLDYIDSTYLATEANRDIAAVFNPADADLGKGEPEPENPDTGEFPITAVDSGQDKSLKNSKNKILIRNETDFGINVEEFLGGSLNLNMKGNDPKVLIVHTHTTESYSPEGASTYTAGKSDRSLDEAQNMIAVGEAVCAVFNKNGIKAIHDKTVHDHPSFNGSYASSLKTIEGYLAKYPSICIVLDLHRDAFVYENGSKAKFVTNIDGKDTAQLMLVVGTNGGGLDHENWRENMKLALKLQNHIIKKYPSLMRGVNLRKERFNGHATTGSMIIEVGSSGNTLSEAIRGAVLGAEEIADFLKSI